jgi:hypothetical protein
MFQYGDQVTHPSFGLPGIVLAKPADKPGFEKVLFGHRTRATLVSADRLTLVSTEAERLAAR